jgi:NTE family protein
MPDTQLHPVHELPTRPPEAGMALCLSGGGYRAMMFHAGCLWRLNELGLLGSLKRISSVSGGSITAGVLGMNWASLNVAAGSASSQFVQAVIDPIRKMAATTVDEGAILGGIFLPGSISDHVVDKYSKVLFGNKTLQDLPDAPRFVINATNVQSGVLMRFSKPYMRDFRVGQVLKPKLPLARAVAASSAFPPVLSPCEIKVADYGLKFEPPGPGEDMNCPPYTSDLVLSDGGVYDNLGLETAWKRYDTILVSDAGAHFKAEPTPHHDWARHAYRVLDLIDSQVRALRTRQLIALYKAGERKGCYWGIRQPYPAGAGLVCPPAKTTELAATPTRLKAMDASIQERLINWGYAICDASLRTYFDTSLPKPTQFPYPATAV